MRGATEVSSTSLQDRRPLTPGDGGRAVSVFGELGRRRDNRVAEDAAVRGFVPSIGNDKSLRAGGLGPVGGGRRIQVKLLRKLHHTVHCRYRTFEQVNVTKR